MKKEMVFVLVLSMLLSMTVVGFAQGQPDFEASIMITADEGLHVEVGSELELTAEWAANRDVNREEWTIMGEEQGATNISGSVGTSYITFDATDLDPGYYNVSFRIWHHQQDDRDATETDRIEVFEATAAIYVEPMAAPSIAAKILEHNGVQARYGQGRNGGNFIADVARNMGPEATFEDFEKAVWSEEAEAYVANPEYWNAVLDYLDGHKAMKTDLTGDFDWYVNSLE